MTGSSSPRILSSTALAKATQLASRMTALVTSTTGPTASVTEYLKGTTTELSENGSVTAGGTWTCPAGVTQVQVECWGAGGGGGGGTSSSGGGGGGAGEYAAELAYPVIPGQVYSFGIGREGKGGVCGSGLGGSPGGITVFDLQGTGIAGGVQANGGGGGDGASLYNGGSGSPNSVHFSGGNGGASTSGVNSDNPSLQPALILWWPMDDLPASSKFHDMSGNNWYGTQAQSGAADFVTVAMGAPPQAPTSTISGTSLEGNSNGYAQDSYGAAYATVGHFGLGSGRPAPYDGSSLTVSAWVQADAANSRWSLIPSHGVNYATVFANSNYPSGIAGGPSASGANGYALFLSNGKPSFYLSSSASGGAQLTVTAPSALPVTSTWHMITATYDGTTMRLYVDGALAASGAPGLPGGKFAQGSYGSVQGANPATRADSLFCGFISNAWIAASAASGGYVSAAYGTTAALGGSGGGASGGSAGTGLNGTPATSSSGAAGAPGAAGTGYQGGSGAGGNGGNSPGNGSAAPVITPYGGGGGGAGAVTSSLAPVTPVTVTAQQCASYCGFDAQGGNNGVLFSVSGQPQGGIANPFPDTALLSSAAYAGGAPGSPFNGSLNSVVLLSSAVASLAGQDVSTATISVTVQGTAASILPVAYASASYLPPSLGSDADVSAYLGTVTPLVMIPVPAGTAGRTVAFDVTSPGFITALGAGPVALVIGGLQGSSGDIGSGAYNSPDSYAWETTLTGVSDDSGTGGIVITLETWPAGSPNTTGGDGAPGAIVVTYLTPAYWPVAALHATGGTDDTGNQVAAGITADSVVAFQGGSSSAPPRVPETWHSLGALAAGSGLTVLRARYRCSPEDGGSLVVQYSAYAATSTVITAGFYAFANAVSPSAIIPSTSATAAQDIFPFPLACTVGNASAPALATGQLAGASSAAPGQAGLLIPSTLTTTGPAHLHGIARIPLS